MLMIIFLCLPLTINARSLRHVAGLSDLVFDCGILDCRFGHIFDLAVVVLSSFLQKLVRLVADVAFNYQHCFCSNSSLAWSVLISSISATSFSTVPII